MEIDACFKYLITLTICLLDIYSENQPFFLRSKLLKNFLLLAVYYLREMVHSVLNWLIIK